MNGNLNNMCEFKVGDKVLCVEGATGIRCADLIEGNTYTILEIAKCECGTYSVYVGINLYITGRTICRTCNKRSKPGRWYHRPSRFVKESSKSTTIDVSEFMEIFTTTKKIIEIN